MSGPVIFGIPAWTLGGPSVYIERLARGLIAGGRDAQILLTEADTLAVTHDMALRTPPTDVPVDTLPCGPHDSWGDRWEALIRYLEERAPCTYVMVHDWRGNVVAPRLSDRIRLVGIVQADVELELDQAVRLGQHWDAAVAVSDVIRFALSQRAPALAPRLLTIPNAAPAGPTVTATEPVARPNDGTLRIAFSGELRAAQKRLLDLIAIAHELSARGIDAELTIMGEGAERATLEAAAGPLIEAGRVRFTGLLPNDQVLEMLHRTDAFVLTSEYEGVSLALLEAMSHGCVPVVTDLASQATLVEHGRSGYRVPIGHVAGFADRLTALAHDPALRARLSAGAIQAVEAGSHGQADMVRAFAELLDAVEHRAAHRHFVRRRDALIVPPRMVGGIGVMSGDQREDSMHVNAQEGWPDAHRSAAATASPHRGWAATPLRDHRVLVAVPSGQISGVDTFSTHLVRGLLDRGIDAAILGQARREGPLGLQLAGDVPIEEAPYRPGMSWRERWRTLTGHLAGQGPAIYLPGYDFDHSGVSGALPDHVKVVAIAHSDETAHYGHVMRIGDASNAIVGVSDAITAHLAGLAPGWVERLHSVPYGVDLGPDLDPGPSTDLEASTEHDARSPLRIVYVGRVVEHQKRTEDLVRIAGELAARGVDFALTIVGDGPERAALQAHATELERAGRIRFAGTMDNAAVLGLLRESDAFLLVSCFEGLSVSMLEAMACGTVPVVSATRSGVPQVLRHGENGLVAPIGSVEAFADHLQSLADDRSRCQRLGVAARQTIIDQQLTTSAMVDRYVDVFEQAVSRPFDGIRTGVVIPPAIQAELSLRRRVRTTLSRSADRIAPRRQPTALGDSGP